ncbi:hypothetical protein EHO61_08860 [Leptospira fluminis]|uniref:Uncharacterized protein n=1 Tax=Leptospira fluminis TaxID=2484979 RepID=A0A4R9GQT3_9LEPT|nr:hypothetical protein [Leptospira fluminis]TGK19001.1 hypothetical protein EHO61_08860 [Leptospira fluminis]
MATQSKKLRSEFPKRVVRSKISNFEQYVQSEIERIRKKAETPPTPTWISKGQVVARIQKELYKEIQEHIRDSSLHPKIEDPWKAAKLNAMEYINRLNTPAKLAYLRVKDQFKQEWNEYIQYKKEQENPKGISNKKE